MQQDDWATKYLKGEIKLWKSFWLIHFPVNFIANAIAKMLSYITFDQGLYLAIATLILWMILIAIALWDVIGLWKSATNHSKQYNRIGWGTVCKGFIIINISVSIAAQILGAIK